MNATRPSLPDTREALARALRSLRNVTTAQRDPVTGAVRIHRVYTRRDLRRYAAKARASLV